MLQHNWRKIGRWAALIGATFIGLLVLLLGIARSYLSDARVQKIIQDAVVTQTGAPCELGGVHWGITEGIELRDGKIGAPPGYSQSLLRFSRVAVAWSFWDLFALRLRLREIAFEGLWVVLEKTATGWNFAPQKPSAASSSSPAAPEKPPAEVTPTPFSLPSLPIEVIVERLFFELRGIEVLEPQRSIHAERVVLEGAFLGKGQSISTDLTLQVLGEKPDAPGRVTLVQTQSPKNVLINEAFRFAIRARGYGDLEVQLKNRTTIESSELPRLDVQGEMELRANLLTRTLTLNKNLWKVGERSFLEMTGEANQLFGDAGLQLQNTTLLLDLAEMSALLKTFVSEQRMAGTVAVSLPPTSVSLAALQHPEHLQTTVHAEGQNISVQVNGQRVEAGNLLMTLQLQNGNATLSNQFKAQKLVVPPQEVVDLNVDLFVQTPLQPWLAPSPDGNVDAKLRIDAAQLSLGEQSLTQLTVKLGVLSPVELLQKKKSQNPAKIDLSFSLGSYANKTLRIPAIGQKLHMLLYDLQGNRFDIGELTGQAGRFMDWQASGSFDEVLSARPRIANFTWTLGVADLAKPMALFPDLKNNLEIGGSVELRFRAQGIVPYQQLQQQAVLPHVDMNSGETTWTQAVQMYADYFQGWSDRFAQGLPFSASVALKTEKLIYHDAQNSVDGLHMLATAGLAHTGPFFHVDLGIDDVSSPVVMRGLGWQLRSDFQKGVFVGTSDFKLDHYEQASLVAPMTKVSFDVVTRYKLGGDFVVDKCEVVAPSLGLTANVQGLVTKPLRVALARGWEKPNLAGVDVELAYTLLVDQKHLTAMTSGGPELSGALGFDGEATVKNGQATIHSILHAQDFFYKTPDLLVEKMNGSIPMDFQFRFSKDSEGTVIARDLPLGEGVMTLLTDEQSLKERPVRAPYYSRLRAYRRAHGLRAQKIVSGRYEIEDFLLEGEVRQGQVLVDWFTMHILGGDVSGDLALQIARDASFQGLANMKITNMDASYFAALNLKPGADSELSADMRMAFVFAPSVRDFSLDMNVTKIGAQTLDRFIQLLDPEGRNKSLQDTRGYLWYARLDGLSVWTRYENLNMDLSYKFLPSIPGLGLLWRPIPTELVRRYRLTEKLDVYLQPAIDAYVAPYLGWAAN